MIKVAIALFVLTATNVSAQEFSLTSKAKEVYLGANGGIFYDGFAPQTDLFVSWRNGIYADIWTSTAFNTGWNFDKEVDLMLGKSGKIGKVNYAVDAAWFFLVIKDVVNVNAELSRELKTNSRVNLTPFIRGEWFFPGLKGGPRQGVMGVGGIGGDIKLAVRLGLAFKVWLKKDSGCFDFDSALLSQGRIGFPIKITEKTSLAPGISFSAPISRVNDGRKKEAVWELAFSRSF